MERRLKTNLVLALAVVALVALAWRLPQETPSAPTFQALDVSALQRIDVREAGELHLRLERRGEHWQVAAPFHLPAERFQVDALLASLAEPATRRYPIEEVDLAELGLDDPQWTVRADDRELRLGGRTAIGNQRYVQADEYVYLVSDVLTYRLQRPALDYASRRILPPETRIESISLPDGVRIERNNMGWAVTPDDARVSSDALQSLVNAWRHATAMHVAPANSVPHDGEVIVSFGDEQELRFGVERSENGLKLTRDDPAITYTLPVAEAESLLSLSNGARE